mmetsp:Transcript_65031/g.178436  ORF Transcript_65031/g.178436 Transcript_65031/m.178436 type:complete len:111 (-) Transcript_65031:840-1172(-)
MGEMVPILDEMGTKLEKMEEADMVVASAVVMMVVEEMMAMVMVMGEQMAMVGWEQQGHLHTLASHYCHSHSKHRKPGAPVERRAHHWHPISNSLLVTHPNNDSSAREVHP